MPTQHLGPAKVVISKYSSALTRGLLASLLTKLHPFPLASFSSAIERGETSSEKDQKTCSNWVSKGLNICLIVYSFVASRSYSAGLATKAGLEAESACWLSVAKGADLSITTSVRHRREYLELCKQRNEDVRCGNLVTKRWCRCSKVKNDGGLVYLPYAIHAKS